MSIRTATLVSASTAAAYGAYKAGEFWYEQDLKKRMPEGGEVQSIFPFMDAASIACQEAGLEVVFMGGPVKQALCDPETEISTSQREIIVSKNPESRTNKKATLYRPNFTIRDLDLLTTSLDGQPALPEHRDKLEAYADELQERLDDKAAQLGFPKGPKVSLFGYEDLFSDFNITHYATRTQYHPNGEVMSHSLGASQVFTPQENWTFVADHEGQEIRVPTTAPVRILGRTLVRSLIVRDRDNEEVYEAVKNLCSKGLGEELLGEEWLSYEDLRHKMDSSFRINNAMSLISARQPVTALNLVAGKLLAPLASPIENSYVADMMQDPESPIYRFVAKLMGTK